MSLSVIIPSRTVANLMPCAEAVGKCEPDARLIVVLDGPLRDAIRLMCQDPPRDNYLRLHGIDPFIFARNCNLGIQATGDDDVILLNDDAILETPGGFSAMQKAAREHGLGLVSSSTNVAGNPEQNRRAQDGFRILGRTPGNSFPTVAFVCVLIPRETIKQVGLMDERFGGLTPAGKRIYGSCDNDYCRRVHLAGLKTAVHDGCFVDHGRLPSTFRSDPDTMDMQAGREIYLKKWRTM